MRAAADRPHVVQKSLNLLGDNTSDHPELLARTTDVSEANFFVRSRVTSDLLIWSTASSAQLAVGSSYPRLWRMSASLTSQGITDNQARWAALHPSFLYCASRWACWVRGPFERDIQAFL